MRLGLQTALAQDKDIINVLVGHDVHLPPRHALPDELQELVTFPRIRLRPEVETWTYDIDSIGRRLTAFDLKYNEAGADELPTPSRKKAVSRAFRRISSARHETTFLAGNHGRTPLRKNIRTNVRSCGRILSSAHSGKRSNSWLTLRRALTASTTILDGPTNGKLLRSG